MYIFGSYPTVQALAQSYTLVESSTGLVFGAGFESTSLRATVHRHHLRITEQFTKKGLEELSEYEELRRSFSSARKYSRYVL